MREDRAKYDNIWAGKWKLNAKKAHIDKDLACCRWNEAEFRSGRLDKRIECSQHAKATCKV
jgi:hypothetical protein